MIELDHPDLPIEARPLGPAAGGIRLASETGLMVPAPAVTIDPAETLRYLDPSADRSPTLIPTHIPLGYLSSLALPTEFRQVKEIAGFSALADPRRIASRTYWLTPSKDTLYLASPARVSSLDFTLILRYTVPSFVDTTYAYTLPEAFGGATIESIEADGLTFERQNGPSYTQPLQYRVSGDDFELYQGNYRLAAQANVFVHIRHSLTLDPMAVLQQFSLPGNGAIAQVDAFTYTFDRPADFYRPQVGTLYWNNDRRLAVVALPLDWEYTLTIVPPQVTPIFEVASEVTG